MEIKSASTGAAVYSEGKEIWHFGQAQPSSAALTLIGSDVVSLQVDQAALPSTAPVVQTLEAFGPAFWILAAGAAFLLLKR
jgi:hypothetical protein